MSSTTGTEDRDNTRLAPKIDWIHLPTAATVASLWDSLHDGELKAIRSDLFTRAVIMEFQIWYLNTFHGLPDDCRFSFEFLTVSSARATRWSQWPGEFQVPNGTPWLEQERLVADYQAKWREESDSWQSVEARLSSGDVNALEVSNADLAVGPGAVALRLETQSDDHGFQVLTIAAEELRIRRTHDIDLSLEDFVRLGNDYWTAFANRSA